MKSARLVSASEPPLPSSAVTTPLGCYNHWKGWFVMIGVGVCTVPLWCACFWSWCYSQGEKLGGDTVIIHTETCDVMTQVYGSEHLAVGEAAGLNAAGRDKVASSVIHPAGRSLSVRSSPLSSPISCRAASCPAHSPCDTSLNFIVDYPSERQGRGRRPLPVSKLKATEKWGRRLWRKDDLCFDLKDFDGQVQNSTSAQGENIYQIFLDTHM